MSFNKLKNNLASNLDRYLLMAIVFLLPFERLPSLDYFNITFRLSHLAAGFIILRALYKVFVLGNRAIIKSTSVRMLFLFLGWVALSGIIAVNIQRAFLVIVATWFVALTAVSIAILFDKSYIKSIITALLVSTGFVVTFGFYQYLGDIMGLPTNLTGIKEMYSWRVYGFPRMHSVATEPLYYCSFLLLPLMVLYTRILLQKKSSIPARALSLFVTLAIFMTMSRGGVVALFFGTIFLILYLLIQKKLVVMNLVSLLAIIFVSFILSIFITTYTARSPQDESLTKGKKGSAAYTEHMQDINMNSGGDDRAYTRNQALKFLNQDKRRYIFGIGAGQFGIYEQKNISRSEGWIIVNNETIELLLEYGLVGLVLLGVFLVSLVFNMHKKIVTQSNVQIINITIALLAYFVAAAVQYQTFSTLYIMHIWVAIGLALAITVQNNGKKQPARKKTA